MQIWSDSCLYSVSGLYSEPVYRCTMTHFPATLASPSPELAASRQQAVVPRPARRLAWPLSRARAGPEPGLGWENLENLATCCSQPVAAPSPVSQPLANMVQDTEIVAGIWGNNIPGGTQIHCVNVTVWSHCAVVSDPSMSAIL